MNFKMIKGIGVTVLLCALASAAISCKTPREAKARGAWRPIFDGRNTDGWQMVGPGEVKLERGELVTHGGMGLFWYSREKFGDCRIRVLFKPRSEEHTSELQSQS